MKTVTEHSLKSPKCQNKFMFYSNSGFIPNNKKHITQFLRTLVSMHALFSDEFSRQLRECRHLHLPTWLVFVKFSEKIYYTVICMPIVRKVLERSNISEVSEEPKMKFAITYIQENYVFKNSQLFLFCRGSSIGKNFHKTSRP